MTEIQIELFLFLVFLSAAFWIVPFKYRMHYVSGITLLFLIYVSPITAVFFSLSTCLTYLLSVWFMRTKNSKILFFSIALYSLFFLAYQYTTQGESVPLKIIGFTYFTCRQIHYLIEVFKGSISTLNFSRYVNYQFYLPVIFAGPIHRYQNFQTQVLRSTLSAQNISLGIERVLYGYFKLVVIGNYLVQTKLLFALTEFVSNPTLYLYGTSAINWTYIYFAFSGLTDIALGFSKIMGIKLEENFNHPYKANSLIDFWSRWHMTLTGWARDYVFMPTFLASRSRVIATLAALIVIGFWHEISLQYVIWGAYQALGIILCKVYQDSNDILKLGKLPLVLEITIKKIATFLWLLSLTPLLNMLGF